MKELSRIPRIGVAGWSYEDWKDIVYPPGIKEHPLAILACWFDLIEINVSFYRKDVLVHVPFWIDHVRNNPSCCFAVKLYRGFTHDAQWPDTSTIMSIRGGLEYLQEARRLAALLIQFPWSYRRTIPNRERLARIVDTFNDFPLVVELRHDSWWAPAVHRSFNERNIALCAIDQPQFHDSFKPSAVVTASHAYIRLHGRNKDNWFRETASRNDRYDYLYTPAELDEWSVRIRNMAVLAEEVYVVTNNHYKGQAVVNALELKHILNGQSFHLPDSLLQAYPRLHRLAIPR